MSEQAEVGTQRPETIQVFHHPNCGTCKKALAAFKAAGAEVSLIDLRDTAPSIEALRAYFHLAGLPIRRWFNTSGQSYRAGAWSTKLPTLSEDDALQALAADGMLIKRPIIALGDGEARRVLVGFDAEAITALLAERRA